jgi:hypothetical protein
MVKRRSIASPAPTGCPACDTPPNERCASDRHLSGRARTSTSKLRPERAAAASAR